MAKYKVYITDYDYPDNEIEKSILEPIGAEVIGLKCKDGKHIDELAKDADALMVQYARVDKNTIDRLPNLKIIARYGIGVDIVDVKTAYDKGIVCTNVMGYCTDEVADHNVALILMMVRRIPMYVKETKAGKWHWSETGRPVHRFNALTVGVIGFGRIGRNMGEKLQDLGFNLVYFDPFVKEDSLGRLKARSLSLDELCRVSDVVVLQCPYTAETHHIINERTLGLMKKDAILVDCSRGKLVDNKALYKALSEGQIAAAGLDDPEEEPAKRFDWTPDMNPLFSLDNCFITPHVAYYSEESILDARRIASENVKAVLLGQKPINPVYPANH